MRDRPPTEREREHILLALELVCRRFPSGDVVFIADYSDERIAALVASDLHWTRVAHLRRLHIGKLNH